MSSALIVIGPPPVDISPIVQNGQFLGHDIILSPCTADTAVDDILIRTYHPADLVIRGM
jgi:hypothetical protein